MKHLPPLDLKALLAPLDEHQPAGTFDEEAELFQNIDHEMVKLGGLQERSINWSLVDQGARHYLGSQCKHLRIAGHLMTAHLRTHSWRGWAESAGLLAGMVERYWETAYPTPGAKGYTGKRRLVAQYLERLGDALPRLDRKGYAEDFYTSAQGALDSLQTNAALARLDVPELSRLEGKLRQHAESNRAPELSERATDQPVASETLANDFFLPVIASPGSERENRRSLLSAAEIITQQDTYDPTGYLLRRFALWAHLTQAPSPTKNSRTELMAVPRDVAVGYDKAIATNSIGPALLQRVERSVASCPYWLRGSYLSADIARKLDMPRVAEAIRQTSERFVTRLPALATLAFADGRAFIDDETQAWLSGASQDVGTCSGLAYPALRDELSALLDTGGVESMLRNLESLQQQKTDVRHGCHVMAIAAELLASRGLNWLADGLYARARSVMDSATTRAWEPELYDVLVRRAPAGEEHKN